MPFSFPSSPCRASPFLLFSLPQLFAAFTRSEQCLEIIPSLRGPPSASPSCRPWAQINGAFAKAASTDARFPRVRAIAKGEGRHFGGTVPLQRPPAERPPAACDFPPPYATDQFRTDIPPKFGSCVLKDGVEDIRRNAWRITRTPWGSKSRPLPAARRPSSAKPRTALACSPPDWQLHAEVQLPSHTRSGALPPHRKTEQQSQAS